MLVHVHGEYVLRFHLQTGFNLTKITCPRRTSIPATIILTNTLGVSMSSGTFEPRLNRRTVTMDDTKVL